VLRELEHDRREAGTRPGERVENDDCAGPRTARAVFGAGLTGPRHCASGGSRISQAGQVSPRGPPCRVTALERLPPAGQQVEVDLIALGAGNRVVVGAECEQPPRFVQAGGRVRRARQPGGRGKPLAIENRDLAVSLRLLGIWLSSQRSHSWLL